jgi:hypothetical protein
MISVVYARAIIVLTGISSQSPCRPGLLILLENRRIRRDAARLAGNPDAGLEADQTPFTPDLFG